MIGGCTQPAGERKHMGALLVGVNENGRLKFAGRVGTGFSEKLLKTLSLELNKIAVRFCPFFNLPATGRGLDPGLTVAEMKRCVWVKPVMVCQSNSRNGLGMIGCDNRCFSELGKTRIRKRWSERKQANPKCRFGSGRITLFLRR